MDCRDDNERRVARMDVWIDLADRTEATEDRAHLRFALYWTAYEAAYQVYEPSGNSRDKKKREAFHLQVTRCASPELQDTLSRHRESIVKLLELRQANGRFWYRGDQPTTSAAAWEKGFLDWVGRAKRRLDNLETASTLDDVFGNLSVVRNQIVHGASAGVHSRGRTQVLLGATLLADLIPRFRDTISSSLEEDWGSPPFPRVGTRSDDECQPPWMRTGGDAGA